MDLFLIDAIPLDTELVSDYPQIVKLGDHLFDEVAAVAKITNKGDSKVVNDHLNGATDDRRNGATRKRPKSDFGRPLKLGFFTSFLGCFFCSLTIGF